MIDQHTTQFFDIKNLLLTLAALFLTIFSTVVAVMGMYQQASATSHLPLLADTSTARASDILTVQASESIRIGVLAHKGADICMKMWQPTMDYLNEALPGRQFDLEPLQYNDVESAVRNKSIDFLICNPAIYVDLEVRYGVTRTMTLRNLVGTQIVSEYGGVVFCRADRRDLQDLRDVRGQRLAATEQTSFGGWRMALREFWAAGIDPERDCARLVFLDTHPAVVHAVLSGEADIGTVRTDTIERMAADGEIRMDVIRVISANVAPESRSTFPYLHSTRLYPEWPFAKLSDTNDELSRELAVALLGMPADSPAAKAAQSGGWGVCLSYTSVHDCLRDLRLPPYQHYGQLSWLDVWRHYWPWLVAITALIIALLATLLLLRGRQLAVIRVSDQNRLLLASAGEGICGIDMNGITTFINPAADKMLGYTTGELLGKNLHALTHHTKPDGRPYPNHECPGYKSCNDGGIHQGCEEFFYRKDGRIIPVSYSSRPIVDMGKIRGAVICFKDITERKHAEEEKAKLEGQLQHAQKIQSIGYLAGGIAHDLNNILFPISGLSEMLLDDIPPGNPARESVEQIYNSAQRGSDLVKQILAFSRQSNPRKLPIRIQPILKEVLKLARATIPMNIEITSHIKQDCGMVSADPTQVHQILMNLITNAHHAVEGNGGTINVELKEMTPRWNISMSHPAFGEKDDLRDNSMPEDILVGRYACITISDTGTGIDPTQIDKIFDPYFTTKELGKGTGLGLSVVHGIVKEHGGDIRIYSEVGKGTAFNVYLPIIEDEMDGKDASVIRKSQTGSERILLVDDEEPIVRTEQIMLEKLGYQITVRTSSPDALAAFKANPGNFDLVISDRGMPLMTGEQLAMELILIKPGIPVIICTGFSNEDDKQQAMDMGIKGFLIKPVSLDDMAAMVRQVLDAE
jgi:two-component system sensor histidine kinase TtrS